MGDVVPLTPPDPDVVALACSVELLANTLARLVDADRALNARIDRVVARLI